MAKAELDVKQDSSERVSDNFETLAQFQIGKQINSVSWCPRLISF